jgi:hypothetical protein
MCSFPSAVATCQGSKLWQSSWLFDYDSQWAQDHHFVHYDFHKPVDVPAHLQHTFTYVVIDPPFITSEVWRSYAQTVQLLLKPGGEGDSILLPQA